MGTFSNIKFSKKNGDPSPIFHLAILRTTPDVVMRMIDVYLPMLFYVLYSFLRNSKKLLQENYRDIWKITLKQFMPKGESGLYNLLTDSFSWVQCADQRDLVNPTLNKCMCIMKNEYNSSIISSEL